MSDRSFVPLAEQLEDREALDSLSTQEKVIALINEAQLVSKDKKLECLSQVRELIINKDPSLLDSFFEEVTAFQQDTSNDVRKFVLGFIEDACKKDSHLLTRSVPMLRYMMTDDNINVEKRVIVCLMQLYRLALTHLVKVKSAEEECVEMWEALKEAKNEIYVKLNGDNDGVRTLVIKFIEMIILGQTKKEQGSEPSRSNEIDFSLDMVPLNHLILKTAELKEEAGMLLGQILELSSSPDISSVNLMTCISTLCTIARQRPLHMTTVVQTFELLHANLPPNYTSSQINSVTKHLKNQLLAVLRQPASFECRDQLITLLTALGCSQNEIAKNTPKDVSTKRTRGDNEGSSSSKKPRVGQSPPVEEEAESSTRVNRLMEAIEMTTTDLKPLLNPEAVTEIVIESMSNLPTIIPKNFRFSYTPIAAAGTDAQVTQVARLLASQMTAAGIGIGAQSKGIQPQRSKGDMPVVSDPRRRGRAPTPEEEREREIREREKLTQVKEEPAEELNLEESIAQLSYLGSLLGLPDIMDPQFPLAYAAFFGSLPAIEQEIEPMETTQDTIQSTNLVAIETKETEEAEEEGTIKGKKRTFAAVSAPPQKLKKIKLFDLSSIVKPLTKEQQHTMSVAAFQRILAAEKVASHSGANQIRNRLIIHLVTQFRGDFNKEFILEDLRLHFDLAISWLYAEYCVQEQYMTTPHQNFQYDACLIRLLKGAHSKLDGRDRLFTRLVLEAPRITPNALIIIKSYCRDEDRAFLGLTTLRDLVIKKPQGTNDFLEALLDVTTSDLELARAQALHISKRFYGKPDLSSKIEKFAVQTLQKLLSDHPSFQQDTELEVASEWSEETVKICSGLFLSLLPLNSQLIKELAIVYTNTSPNVKRILLKLLDQPVRSIGMGSPELLELVQNCPSGAETLIMRILYILTEKAAPSPELVKRVRELHQRNSSDVRFLIPVLHGLQKSEVIAVLPQFIRLSPNVMRGVFERLLTSYKGEGSVSMSPVSPSELMIALHNIDCRGDDNLMKAVIRATNLCFSEKTVYTQEVLAVVLQQLVEQTPVPLLFMRTVIQSLGVCPRLVNFILTILTKLISKQVWKQPKIWQGFIKCCETIKPHSFQVLLQLPPKQLESILEASTALRVPFIEHVTNFTPNQKATVPRSVMQIIEKEITGRKTQTTI